MKKFSFKKLNKPKVVPSEDWRDAEDWWRAPILDSEYGEYDYYATPLPQNVHDERRWDKYGTHCDSCGKYSRLYWYSCDYFYTLDGYDYLSYTECPRCRLKYTLRQWKKTFNKKFKNNKNSQ